jgi:hypothetical protein
MMNPIPPNQSELSPSASDPGGQGLEKEIALIRGLIARIEAQAGEVEDIKELLRMLTTVSSATQRLASLLRIQQDLAGQSGSAARLNERLDRILVNLAREKGIIE